MSRPTDLTISAIDHADHAALRRCHAVVRELRPDYAEAEDFVQAASESQARGATYAFLEHAGVVRSFTGYHIHMSLSWGTYMYVDDLVTRKEDHGKGYGSALFDWLVAQARQRDCTQVRLDSGVQRFDAHRFYLHKGMNIYCHNFGLPL